MGRGISFSLVALVALISASSACTFFAGQGLQVDLSPIAVNNTGPLPTHEDERKIVLNPCAKLQYDALIPEDNNQCSPSDNACVLQNDPAEGLIPAHTGGSYYSTTVDGNSTLVHISGYWVEASNRYMDINIYLECSQEGLGQPTFEGYEPLLEQYNYKWLTSAACTKPVTNPPDLPWERNDYPVPTHVIHRGKYTINRPANIALQGYLITSEIDLVGDKLGPKFCTVMELGYQACTLEDVPSVEIKLKDVVLFSLVIEGDHGLSPVYFSASPGYFALTDLVEFDKNLFSFAPASSAYPIALAHGDRYVKAFTFTDGEATSGAFNFLKIEKYQIASEGANPLTPGAKLGVLFGVIIGVILIAVIIYCVVRRKSTKYDVIET